MKAYEVSRVVNSVKNDTPECVEPLPAVSREQVSRPLGRG